MTSYRLAPEWVRQDAVILVWPHLHSDWAQSDNGNQLKTIDKTYVELSRYLSRKQNLIIVAHDPSHLDHIQTSLANNDIKFEYIKFLKINTNDTWVRDYGPIFVQDGSQSTLLNFKFDAWGNKYPHDKDNSFNQALNQSLNTNSELIEIDFVLEGGNIEVNSKGSILSSSRCFKRKLLKDEITLSSLEANFRKWFGCVHVCWINDVKLVGDDTDGHIDNLARFCADDIIVYSATNNSSDTNKTTLKCLAEQLQKINQNHANSFELIPISLPSPITYENTQLPASYVNFLITNDYVLVPVFSDKNDNQALKMIDDCFPSREIIEIESTTLIQQFGGIHCATMQIPQGFLT